ncbi:MAG: hypothetical protein EZS28_030093 [Streblomastix strix]|uniref:Uncharacterized protein n=1 Tax=Streblomastix strix TaxID=222440 RepID=A0A5J4UWU5_9EUKA|nr:MAG: hypothetical protein EZS28_030093 [Streblomastix strix]
MGQKFYQSLNWTAIIHFISDRPTDFRQHGYFWEVQVGTLAHMDISHHSSTLLTLWHYVQYGGNPTCQLKTQYTQCTRCKWTIHIISPQFKLMARMAL